MFPALADPTRRKILRLLSRGELPAGAIGDQFPIAGSSMSHHLSILKRAGLVVARREGQQIVYTLNTTVVQGILGMVLEVFEPSEESR